jgi:hypothetical protein
MRQKIILTAIVTFFSANSFALCNADGAFGIKFGNKVSKDAVRLSGGKASTFYSVKVPEPNPAFDEYQARIDTKTKKIFEIIATKIITPMPTSRLGGLNPEQIEEGQTKARNAAESFLALLPKEQQERVTRNEYGSPQWHLAINEEVILEINGYGPWDAYIRCTSLSGELELGKRVLPELFE